MKRTKGSRKLADDQVEQDNSLQREVHDVCDDRRDIATARLIENWIDETGRRTWFLFEASRRGDATGH